MPKGTSGAGTHENGTHANDYTLRVREREREKERERDLEHKEDVKEGLGLVACYVWILAGHAVIGCPRQCSGDIEKNVLDVDTVVSRTPSSNRG